MLREIEDECADKSFECFVYMQMLNVCALKDSAFSDCLVNANGQVVDGRNKTKVLEVTQFLVENANITTGPDKVRGHLETEIKNQSVFSSIPIELVHLY